MRTFLTLLLATALWAASLFVRVGSLETSQIKHTVTTIYIGSAYQWISEAMHDPVTALSSTLVLIIFGILLILDLLHIGFCLALAWMCVRFCLGQPLPPMPLSVHHSRADRVGTASKE